MSVFTDLSIEDINNISKKSGKNFIPDSLEHVLDGKTDSCFYLRDTKDKYFVKIHEDGRSSPHSTNYDLRYAIEFAHYLSCFNDQFNYLNILRPVRWKNGEWYGHFKQSEGFEHNKLISIWPYIEPIHPVPSEISGNFDHSSIIKFGKAVGELHNVSSKYLPSIKYPFPKDLMDILNTMRKIEALPKKKENIQKYLYLNKNIKIINVECFFKDLNEMISICINEWTKRRVDQNLKFGYIHGELKPSNTIIHNNKLTFIDISKCGIAPLSLELGMSSQLFANTECLNIIGIERFIEAYLSTRSDFSKTELSFIPLMIKCSSIRLAVYRTYAVTAGFINQKSIISPLEICKEVERIEDDLLAKLTS